MKLALPSKKILISAGLLLMAAASLGLLIFGQWGLLELHRLKDQSSALERDNAQLLERNRALSRRIDSLRDDPAAIERLARERLGMIKEGEVVYYLPAAQGPAGTGQKR